jgi:hypothetical protein
VKRLIPLLLWVASVTGACQETYARRVEGLVGRVGGQSLTVAYFRSDELKDGDRTAYQGRAIEVATIPITAPDQTAFQVVAPPLAPDEHVASVVVAAEGVNEWVLLNVVGQPAPNAADPALSVGTERAPYLIVNGREPRPLTNNEGEPVRACFATVHALPDDTAVVVLRADDGRVRMVRVNAGLSILSNRAIDDLAIHGAGACERAGDGIAVANHEGTFLVLAPIDDLSDPEALVIPSAGIGAYVGPLDGSGEVTAGFAVDGTPKAAWIHVEPGPPEAPGEVAEVVITTRGIVHSALNTLLVTDGAAVLDGGKAPVCVAATFDPAGRALILGATGAALFYKERDGALLQVRLPGAARGDGGCAIDYVDNRPRLMWVREELSTGERRSQLAYYTVESNIAVSLLDPVLLTPDRLQDRTASLLPVPPGADAGATDTAP